MEHCLAQLFKIFLKMVMVSAITAVPNTGYHFVNWSDGLTTNPRTDTSITSNLSVTAKFCY
jgi:uncharacterized repeat protein (TIGR02543 family)